MISRFSRRGLCFFLALVTLCMCLSPSLAQPAEAVAGIDDATLAVGMLFLGWAGVSFATNDAAVTCTTNFLNSSVAGLKAASEVAANYVVDGSLKLVQDVKDAFSSVLPDIHATFRTPEGSDSGALAGSYPVGVPVDIPFDGSYVSVDGDSSNFYVTTDDGVFDLHLVISTTSEGRSHAQLVDSSGASFIGVIGTSSMTYVYSDLRCYIKEGNLCFEVCYTHSKYPGKFFHQVLTNFLSNPTSATFKIQNLGIESYPAYKRAAKITGKEVTDLAFPANTSIAPTESPSPDEPTKDPDQDNINKLSLATLLLILKNLKGAEAGLLTPEEMIEELKKALGQSQTDPNPDPTTDPSEATEPSELPEPSEDPSSPTTPPTTDPPAFDDMLLPGLRNFFPFCIPFDLYAMMQALCAEPVAPVFTFATSFLGQLYTVDIDLSAWESVAVMIRYMFIAIYIVSLAVATRKFIKW